MERIKWKIQKQLWTAVTKECLVWHDKTVTVLILLTIICLANASSIRTIERTSTSSSSLASSSSASSSSITASNVLITKTKVKTKPIANDDKNVDILRSTIPSYSIVPHLSNSSSMLDTRPSSLSIVTIIERKNPSKRSTITTSHTVMVFIQSIQHNSYKLKVIRDQYQQFVDTYGVQLQNITIHFDFIDGKLSII